jgi:hydrogenase nickel incorporation protein HypA/HybF
VEVGGLRELEIAESVVEIASRKASGRPVERVELKVGHLREVAPSALELAFEVVALGTSLEGARLMIEDVPATGRCRVCGSSTTWESFPLRCSRCGALDLELLTGGELTVGALELGEARGA